MTFPTISQEHRLMSNPSRWRRCGGAALAGFLTIAAPGLAFGQTIGWLFTAGLGVFVNGRSAAIGMPINSGDTVATGTDSSATIQLAASGSVQLDAETQTQFVSFVQASFGCVVRAVLNTGQLYANGTSACVSRGASFILPRSEFNYQAISGAEVLTVTAGNVLVSGAQWTTIPAGTQATIAGGRIVAQRQVGFEEMRRITGWRERYRFTQALPPPAAPPPYLPPPRPRPLYIPLPGRDFPIFLPDRGRGRSHDSDWPRSYPRDRLPR